MIDSSSLCCKIKLQRMKKILSVFICLFGLNSSFAQLSMHSANESWALGLNLSRINVSDKIIGFDAKEKKAFWGVGGEVSYNNFEQWGVRYALDVKWFPDLGHKAFELFRGEGLDPRLEFSGFTWHKLGVNFIATDFFTLGAGLSAADYIIDIHKWNSDTHVPYATNGVWQEPSGWYWTAGPALFLDGGIGDFSGALTLSYDISYFHPIVTEDYEANVDEIVDYPTPNFFHIDLTFMHDSGIYFSFDQTRLIDRGVLKHNMTRTDVQLGYRFFIW